MDIFYPCHIPVTMVPLGQGIDTRLRERTEQSRKFREEASRPKAELSEMQDDRCDSEYRRDEDADAGQVQTDAVTILAD